MFEFTGRFQTQAGPYKRFRVRANSPEEAAQKALARQTGDKQISPLTRYDVEQWRGYYAGGLRQIFIQRVD